MQCHEREDPVSAKILDCTPKEFVEWMVKYHHLPTDRAETVEMNLREQFCWHRLQGRLDQTPWLAALAQLWGLRGDVAKLKRPKEKDPKCAT